MIWIVLLIAGGLCVALIRSRHRARKSAQFLWTHLLNEGALNGFPNKDELLKSFFLADSINPLAFMANYFEVCGSWPSESPAEVGAPTPSAVAFQKGLDAPTGYPRWFLAAYPDVALWVASRDDNTMLRVVAEALYGAEDAKELIRSHGEERAGKLIDEKLRDLDLSQLRRLVTIYRRDNRNRLECSI